MNKIPFQISRPMIKWCAFLMVLCATTIHAKTNWNAAVELNQGETLKHVNEPNLIALSTNATTDLKIARFMYFPAFGDTIIIRVTLREQHARARRLIYSRAAGEDRDLPADIANIEISTKRANDLLKRADLFFSEGRHLKIKDQQGMDGETWVLELMSNGIYHHVAVWIPTHDKKERNTGDFVTICEQMTKLAELSPRSDLKNAPQLKYCDPANDDDFDAILLRPKDPSFIRFKNWILD